MLSSVIIPKIFGITFIILTILASALVLFFLGKIFKVNISYVKALLPALIVVGSIYIINKFFGVFLESLNPWFDRSVLVILSIFLPKLFFKLKWSKGLLIGLLWFVSILIIIFISFILYAMLTFPRP